jgi:hypothetical protein
MHPIPTNLDTGNADVNIISQPRTAIDAEWINHTALGSSLRIHELDGQVV